jgi:transcriptional regulator with XRE-family HTH domain
MSGDQRAAIASRMRLARERAGLSQGQVAKMLQMHRPTISEIEAGRRSVTAEELTKFAKIYAVTIKWLTNEQQDPAIDKVDLAARELLKLKPRDVDRLIDLLTSLRRKPEDK